MYSIYVKRKVYIRKSCVAIFHHHYCSTVITWTSDKSTRETGKEYIPTLHYLAGVSLSLSFFFFLSSMIVSYPPPWRFQMEVFTRRSLENKEKWIDSQRDKSYRWVHIEKVMQRKKKGGGGIYIWWWWYMLHYPFFSFLPLLFPTLDSFDRCWFISILHREYGPKQHGGQVIKRGKHRYVMYHFWWFRTVVSKRYRWCSPDNFKQMV